MHYNVLIIYERKANDLARLWQNVLLRFDKQCDRYTKSALLSAMIKRTPNWEMEIEKGETVSEKLYIYFSKSYESCAASPEYCNFRNNSGDYRGVCSL
jgi:hypothetical protein